MRDAGLVTTAASRSRAAGPATNGRSPHMLASAAMRPVPTARSRGGWPAPSRHPRSPARGRGHRPRDRTGARGECRDGARAGPRRPAGRPGLRTRVRASAAGWAELPPAQLPLPRLGAREPRRRLHPAPRHHPRHSSTRSLPPPRSNASCPTTPTRPAARSTSTGSPTRSVIRAATAPTTALRGGGTLTPARRPGTAMPRAARYHLARGASVSKPRRRTPLVDEWERWPDRGFADAHCRCRPRRAPGRRGPGRLVAYGSESSSDPGSCPSRTLRDVSR